MYTPERIYCTKATSSGVKKVMEVIVGLLKDRVEVDDTLMLRELGQKIN